MHKVPSVVESRKSLEYVYHGLVIANTQRNNQFPSPDNPYQEPVD
jgi:hypothetical protein